MALRWDFKTDKLGWIDTKDKESSMIVRIYDGNALMIANYESDKHYYLHSFFADEEHAKNCLQGDDPIYPMNYVFHLYRQKKANKLARILTKYQYSIIWEDMPNYEEEMRP